MGFFGPRTVASTGRTLPTIPITSGRVLHLDASVASSLYDATSGGNLVSVGGSVARWEDQSGNSRHGTQATSNNRPIYRKYDDVGGLYFDGTNDSFTGSFPTLSAQTVCMACILELNGSNSRLFSQRNTGNTDFSQAGHYIPILQESSGNNIASYATSGFRVSTVMKANNFSLFAIHTGSNLFLRINGTETSTYAHTLNGTFAEYSIASNFGIENFDALIFEIIAYDSALSSADRTSIEDYFKDKYRWAW